MFVCLFVFLFSGFSWGFVWGFFLGGGVFPKVFVIKNETKVSLHKCIKLPLRGGDEPYFYTTYFILQILQM
jgi:hypothetical protein